MNTSRIISLCVVMGLAVAQVRAMEQGPKVKFTDRIADRLTAGAKVEAEKAILAAQEAQEALKAVKTAQEAVDALAKTPNVEQITQAASKAADASKVASEAVKKANEFADSAQSAAIKANGAAAITVEAIKSTQSSAEAAQAAQKASEALRDEVAGLTEEAQKQFAAKTAQLDELLKTQSIELKKAADQAQSTWGKSFVACGKEHKTMLIAGFVGVVAIGGTVYLVHRYGVLTKVTEWVKEHKKLTIGLVGGAALLTAAGLGAAHYFDYIDLGSKAQGAWTGTKAVGSWVGGKYTEWVAPYVGLKIYLGVAGTATAAVAANKIYNRFFGSTEEAPQDEQEENRQEEEAPVNDQQTKGWKNRLPSLASASSLVPSMPSFLSSNKAAEEEAARQEEEARQEEAARLFEAAKTALLEAANSMNAAQVTALAQNFGGNVKTAAAQFVGALESAKSTLKAISSKGITTITSSKIEPYKKHANIRAVADRYTALVNTLQ